MLFYCGHLSRGQGKMDKELGEKGKNIGLCPVMPDVA